MVFLGAEQRWFASAIPSVERQRRIIHRGLLAVGKQLRVPSWRGKQHLKYVGSRFGVVYNASRMYFDLRLSMF